MFSVFFYYFQLGRLGFYGFHNLFHILIFRVVTVHFFEKCFQDHRIKRFHISIQTDSAHQTDCNFRHLHLTTVFKFYFFSKSLFQFAQNKVTDHLPYVRFFFTARSFIVFLIIFVVRREFHNQICALYKNILFYFDGIFI